MPEKKKVGRPTKYRPEMNDIALEMFSKGFSIRSVAAELGVCYDTIFHWRKEIPEFSDTIERGVALALRYLEGKLLEIIENGELKTHPDYFRALHLALKTRFHEVYGEKKQLELESKDSNIVVNLVNATKTNTG